MEATTAQPAPTPVPPAGLTVADLLDAIDGRHDEIAAERRASNRHAFIFGYLASAVSRQLDYPKPDRLRSVLAYTELIAMDAESFAQYEAMAAARRDEDVLAAS